MRKLKLEIQVSIDGYIATTDGGTDWMLWNWGPEWSWDAELQEYHNKLTMSSDCILLSKQMAEEGFKAHWANAAENLHDPQAVFAKYVTQTHTVVFSKTLNKNMPIPGGWDNTTIANGKLEDEIHKLKSKEGKDILVYGGASFVSSLIKANLIDEFHLLVNPVAIGSGLPIFKERTNLQLIAAKGFSSGMVALHYEPIRK